MALLTPQQSEMLMRFAEFNVNGGNWKDFTNHWNGLSENKRTQLTNWLATVGVAPEDVGNAVQYAASGQAFGANASLLGDPNARLAQDKAVIAKAGDVNNLSAGNTTLYNQEVAAGNQAAFNAPNATVGNQNPTATVAAPQGTTPQGQANGTTGQNQAALTGPVDQVMGNQATNPQLPPGTELTPITQQVQQNELMNSNTGIIPTTPGAPQQTPVTPQTATQTNANAATTDPNAATSQVNPTAANYDATKVGTGAQGTAEQGQVNPLATVQGQLASLYAQTQNGQIPIWAKGSVNAANEFLAAHNMAASSIGGAAIQAAVQSSALNIAAQDAATYFNMDLKNLDNRQQTAMENLKNRQQGLLSDQAAENASKQFNASSTAQTQQFMANLVATINNQNADRTTAISQFNAGQANQISTTNAANDLQSQTFNAQQRASIDQFNQTLKYQRDQFNATNQFAVEQSNVLWRRSVNTANTAAVNAANQANVQNKFNLSSTAMQNIWQQFRDEASWLYQSSENEKNRQANLAQIANNQQFVSGSQPNVYAQAIGAFASSLFT